MPQARTPMLVAAALILFLTGSVTQAGLKQSTEKGGGRSPLTEERPDGRGVTITIASQERSGIVTKPLAEASRRSEVRAYGAVLDIRDLLALRTAFLSARMEVKRAEIEAETSRREFERLKELNQEDKNVSDKALQAAEAKSRTDELAVRFSGESLTSTEALVRQQWGDVVAEWLFADSAAFARLTLRQDLLIRITVPQDAEFSRPAGCGSVELPGGNSLPAAFVSLSPRADPRIQGVSLFCLVANRPGLAPGSNVSALIPLGPPVKGVVIPTSAVLWRKGRAWAYVQVGRERFLRREVPLRYPVNEGYFAVKGFPPSTRVVVKGAQTILSREFRGRLQGGEEDED